MTGIYKLTIALACFAFSASGCVRAEFNNPFLGPLGDLMGIVTNPLYAISGIIKNPDGSVIPSASLSFTQNHQLSASGTGSTVGQTTTDSSGHFSFRLRAGSYRVGIIKSNSLAESMNLTVTGGGGTQGQGVAITYEPAAPAGAPAVTKPDTSRGCARRYGDHKWTELFNKCNRKSGFL